MKNYQIILFVIVLSLLSFLYDYHNITFKRPDSFHTWRQTDCTSLALNFYQTDMPFLEPYTHNLTGNEGKTVGEFPIIYFLVGKLYKVFGPKEYIFRIFNMLLYFLGLFYLYKLGVYLFENTFYSLILVLIGFSSPIIVFYANSFIPDVPALSLAYISWFYIARYVKSKRLLDFFIFIFISSLAGLLKITALIPLCVVICVVVFELLFIKIKNRRIASENLGSLILLIFPFLIFFLWLNYAHHYQSINENGYFSLDWDPFWIETAETRKFIWNRLTKDWGWWPDFYHQNILIIAGLAIFSAFRSNVSYFWRVSIFAFISGVFLFILLYFSALNHHDYYIINLLSLIPFVFIFLIYSIKKEFFFNTFFFKLVVIFFTLQAVYHTSERVKYRYSLELNQDLRPFYNMTNEYLVGIGVTADKKILYDGGKMYNGALYLINRFGWSNAYEKFDNPESLELYIEKGASFLFVEGFSKAQNPTYKDYKLIDVFDDSIYIFNLTKKSLNN